MSPTKHTEERPLNGAESSGKTPRPMKRKRSAKSRSKRPFANNSSHEETPKRIKYPCFRCYMREAGYIVSCQGCPARMALMDNSLRITPEVSLELRMPIKTVLQKARLGTLPATKPGKTWLFNPLEYRPALGILQFGELPPRKKHLLRKRKGENHSGKGSV